MVWGRLEEGVINHTRALSVSVIAKTGTEVFLLFHSCSGF